MNKMYTLAVVAGFLLAGCATQSELPPRAIVEPSVIYQAIEVEQALDAREGQAIEAGAPWFKVLPGNIPVIITAPHATRPLRDGNRRFSDGGGTAALALSVAGLTGAHVIYTTEEGPSDPNYYDDNDFKRELARLINEVRPRYVLDIHGSHPYRPYDIDLGTMSGRSLLGEDVLLHELIASLRGEGLDNLSYNYFGASKNQTITKFASGLGVPAIQVEVNTTYLSPSEGNLEAQRFSKLVQALVRYVEKEESGTVK
ncbi:hypothetical protein [Microbulbifer guangxiensis]|uniref:hypothetical protein n=1 Tax=Microbulbifer guangxiensis TaxID=2904249 RepID=UPI001F37E0B3|nr:hypothetical protein [Microbulbifer guangxiensis]